MTISFLTPYLSLIYFVKLVAVTPPTNDKSKADNHLILYFTVSGYHATHP